VATLRLRIKTLEEKNRELTGLLELAYGELALADLSVKGPFKSR
jgi:hypothetical protein